ncbi:serendipity locus protein beta-like [Zeugodacus cucurbitae]|uniref:serendipity locus protein beta-like n=1 Tax=Zeugodacus cucurbitae TaxID=28588 RepID=UPI0023D90ABF|nr:serendipity locus protein beta-like [Zeugodacus cucurbitae]
MNTVNAEICQKKCFLCRRKITSPQNQKLVDSSTCPASKKSFRDVLSYLARHANSELHIGHDESICVTCHFDVVEYDTYLMKALKKQRALLDLIEKAVLGIDSDFDNEFESDMSALDELTNDHFFDDALISDTEIAQTIDDAIGEKSENISRSPSGISRKNRGTVIKCDFCAMRFRTNSGLKRHITHAHKKFSCELCSYSHRNEDYVMLHMNTHDGRNENQCRFCEKEFSTKISTIRHMEVHFNSKKYQCDKCGLCFSQTTVLYNHKLQHEAEEQPLQCEICSQVFKTKRTYRHHMITHRADRPRYKCEYCTKTFTEKYTLKVHKRTHPEAMNSSDVAQSKEQQQNSPSENEGATYDPVKAQTNDNKFNCVICDQIFTAKDHLNKHMEKEHDVILKSLTINNFSEFDVVDEETKKACHICGQMFNAQANLDYHLKYVHAGTF